MTDTQFLTLLATIWIAPHGGQYYGLLLGVSIFLLAIGKGLGWL